MAEARKVIITCAVTGSIHTPSMSPHLPITAEQIADAAIGAAEAGAAIIHLHARDPKTGQPDQSPELFQPFLQTIRQRCDAVLNITTGGSQTMSIEDRLKPAAQFKPEVASLNMGTMNFGLYPMLQRYPRLEPWEAEYLEGTRNGFFRNTLGDIENILKTCAENATRFEVECYDIGHLYTLAHFADRGLIKAPFFIQSVFGILGGIGNHESDIYNMKQTADRLFGTSFVWSVMGAGAAQLRVAALGALLGGNVRVGLEDSLWIGKGQLAQSNADQVR
ncbi:MAG: 3-keto-5-aminohexanoate cleavage protein, partial [Pseudomonadota bacterium]